MLEIVVAKLFYKENKILVVANLKKNFKVKEKIILMWKIGPNCYKK